MRILNTLLLIVAAILLAACQNTEIPKDVPERAVCMVKGRGCSVLVVQGYGVTKFDFPGGHVLPGEFPEDAAVREVFEETGLEVKAISYLYTSGNTHVFSCMVHTGTIVDGPEGHAFYTDIPVNPSNFEFEYLDIANNSGCF